MDNETIEVILPKAWTRGDYYSLIFTNLRLYLIKQTDLNTFGITRLIYRIADYQIRMKEQDEILKQTSLEQIQKDAINSFNYQEMIKPRVKKGLGEGTIRFKYPTGKRFIKTNWWEIGLPKDQTVEITDYLTRYGFNK